MSRHERYLITQTLLASWLYQYRAKDAKAANDDFLCCLRKEPSVTTPPMQNGIDFENMVAACCSGVLPDSSHEWYQAAIDVSGIVMWSQMQVSVWQDIEVDGMPLVLYGRLDALKAGTIYDVKFSKAYKYPGKYMDSPQHPLYMHCVPEAYKFTYIISDGMDVFQETYTRENTPPIKPLIHQFMDYLDRSGLMKEYMEKWISKY